MLQILVFVFSAIYLINRVLLVLDYLLFLSGDSAIVDSDWLENLLNHAQRPEVGAVGPKIINADGKIQSAGLVLGLNGPANSAFVGQDAYAPGYMHRLEIDQNYSAVSGTCLMVRREIFEHVGGFAEEGALLHKARPRRHSPDPRRSYAIAIVSGVPSSVKRLSNATRTCSSVTWRSNVRAITRSPSRLKQCILVSTKLRRW